MNFWLPVWHVKNLEVYSWANGKVCKQAEALLRFSRELRLQGILPSPPPIGEIGRYLLSSSYVVSDSLQPHGLQHASLPHSSLSLKVCSNLCPLSQWCHPTISSSAAPFSFCLQSFPISGSFPMNQLLASGG